MCKAVSAAVVAIFSLGLVSQSFATHTNPKPAQKSGKIQTVSSDKTQSAAPKIMPAVHRSASDKVVKAKNTRTTTGRTGKHGLKSKHSKRHVEKASLDLTRHSSKISGPRA
jgi:hypothetical protein